jgi:hypothetical protein
VAKGVRGVGMTEQYHDRQTMERLHQHLARAERELRDAQHFIDSDSAEEAEIDLVHAVATARLAITTALERVRSRPGEPEAWIRDHRRPLESREKPPQGARRSR